MKLKSDRFPGVHRAGMISRPLLGLWLLGLMLGGCTESVRPPPAELPDFEPSISLREVWHHDTGVGADGALLALRPLVDGGVVYVTDSDGQISAVQATDGNLLWQADTELRITTGPAYSDGKLYFATEAGQLVRFDVAEKTITWQSELSSECIARPVVTGDSIVVQTIDGRVSSFSSRDGRKRWDYIPDNEPALSLRGTAEPVLYRNAVLLGLSDGRVIALNQSSGALEWEARIGDGRGRTELERLTDIDGALKLVDRRLYTVAYQGSLAALDPYDGAVEWTVPTSSYADPAVAKDSVFITTPEGRVEARSRTDGLELWSSELFAWRFLSAPVPWQDHLLIADFDGYIHVLAQADGSPLARFRPGNGDGIRIPPVILDDLIIVYDNSGDLSAWTVD